MNLKPIAPTTTLTNALPKMYDNWQEFYLYWKPWVSSTGQQHLSITQHENGVINLYLIDWEFVREMCQKECENLPHLYISRRVIRFNLWLRDFWRKVGLPAG